MVAGGGTRRISGDSMFLVFVVPLFCSSFSLLTLFEVSYSRLLSGKGGFPVVLAVVLENFDLINLYMGL